MATTQAPRSDGTKKHEIVGHLPIIQTPYSRITEHWFSWQVGPCADAEMDFALCAARVGVNNVEKACKEYHDDFMECAYRIKTMNRYKAMQAEREKQQRPHLPRPAPDGISTWDKDI